MPRKSKKKVAAVAAAATAALEHPSVVPPHEDIEETSPSKKRKLGESDDEDATLEFDSTAVEQLKSASSEAGAIYDSAMDVDNENNVDGSSVVGKKNEGKSGRAEGVPMWMQAANVIDADIQIALADLAKTSLIDDKILENLRTMGVEYLFPVQTEVIPFILRGSIIGGDVSVSAPTGSGKTLTYAIPIVQVRCLPI
jgi:superfamily II DNA helicase RecQ